MKLPDKIQSLLDDIKNDPVIAKYRYKHTWLSGSSTEVYPITVWATSIDIQLDVPTRKKPYCSIYLRYYKILERCMERIGSRHSDALSYCCIKANDGSCPPEMTFYFRDIDLREL